MFIINFYIFLKYCICMYVCVLIKIKLICTVQDKYVNTNVYSGFDSSQLNS